MNVAPSITTVKPNVEFTEIAGLQFGSAASERLGKSLNDMVIS